LQLLPAPDRGKAKEKLAEFFLPLHPPAKEKRMRVLFYLIAILLATGWALGTFAWNAGRLIHVLLLLAMIFLLWGLIRKT
jgi:hypothetical protein